MPVRDPRNRRLAPHVPPPVAEPRLQVVAAPEPVTGELVISGEVIAQIVGLTVLECYGVVGMAASSLTRGVARLLSRERLTQGVQVRRDGDTLAIDLFVVVEYGLNLAEVAANVRSRVQYQVEKMTQLQVSALQIHIQGVRRTQ